MLELVLASRNRGKLREFQQLVRQAGLDGRIRLQGLDAFPEAPDVEESGDTFEENATLKAKAAAEATGLPALADDSGLEVDALGGQPGVRSARYAGEGGGDEANRRKLLTELERAGAAPGQRSARFRCALALAWPGGSRVWMSEGFVEGRITTTPRGTGGFGYDPLFECSECGGKTFAEATPEEKNRVSHRARAFFALLPALRALAEGEAGAEAEPDGQAKTGARAGAGAEADGGPGRENGRGGRI